MGVCFSYSQEGSPIRLAQNLQNFLQILSHLSYSALFRKVRHSLKQRQVNGPAILKEFLVGTWYGVALLAEQMFDLLDELQILLAINTLSRSILLW